MTNEMNNTPFRAVHPAEIIKEEIKARSMTQKELAERMGMKQSNLSRLLKGENITAVVAQKLEDALGIPAEIWVRLQANYDKDVKAVAARDENEKVAIDTEKMLSNMLNLSELYRRLDIKVALFIQSKLAILEERLGFNPIEIGDKDFARQFSCNYKKSDKLGVDEKNQTTWLTLAYIKSRENAPDGVFVYGNAMRAAIEISGTVHKGSLSEKGIKEILGKYGIAYSVVPKLEKTPIDAASMKIGEHPAIITTHRYNDMSRLVFNVLHELGHIEKHMYSSVGDVFVATGETYPSDDPKEKEANVFAQNMLIEEAVWNKMMLSGVTSLRMGSIVSRLKELSKENHLDPNIVIWRYKFESNNYQLRGTRPVPII